MTLACQSIEILINMTIIWRIEYQSMVIIFIARGGSRANVGHFFDIWILRWVSDIYRCCKVRIVNKLCLQFELLYLHNSIYYNWISICMVRFAMLLNEYKQEFYVRKVQKMRNWFDREMFIFADLPLLWAEPMHRTILHHI